MSDDYVKTTDEYHAELLSSDPVLKQIDEQILDRKAGKKTDWHHRRDKLRKEKTAASRALYKAARMLADITFRIESVSGLIARKPDMAGLNHEKKKRIRYLRIKAREMNQGALDDAANEYKKGLMKKKVSPPQEPPKPPPQP